MINYVNAKLEKLIIHYVGNKQNDEGFVLSDSISKITSNEIEGLLTNYFISPFRESEYYSFWHESDMELNACYTFAKEIFSNTNSFVSVSKKILKHLYEQSTHPKIRSGELYISYFKNCILDEEIVEAIGIFKSENKETFFQVEKVDNHFEIEKHEGLSINRIDKACIIFNSNSKDGFKVCVIDNLNKSQEAQYWKDAFLKVRHIQDDYFNTKSFLTLTKEFVLNIMPEEFQVSRTDQIYYLSKAAEYFKIEDELKEREFSKTIFQDQEVVKSFSRFKNDYLKENDIELKNDFNISSLAVKKQSRHFKSVLKLDKNFHVYIHGDPDLIEKGYDQKVKKNYYKIYFDNES